MAMPGIPQGLRGARCPSSASAIEYDFTRLREFPRALFNLIHRNMNGVWDCSGFLDFLRGADIDDQQLF